MDQTEFIRKRISIMIIKLLVLTIILLTNIGGVISDPETKLITKHCIQYKRYDNFSSFSRYFNQVFGDIRKQLVDNSSIHFGTASQPSVFGMVQCRNYLSSLDCGSCLDAAVNEVRSYCYGDDGGHIIYQGCFLRYGVQNFYNQITFYSSDGICSTNQSESQATSFNPAVKGLLTDLVVATPKINGFFAATTRQFSDGGATATVYAVAQCIETITPNDCQSCLNIRYNNIIPCLPKAEGSSGDAGCFLRYSNTSFFADNQTINITSYLRAGSSSTKTTFVGGVAGGLCLFFLILALLLWFALLRKRKLAEKGDILQLTWWQGATVYKYKYLKSSTKNFSEEYKVGEGSFGDVYKSISKNGKIVAVKKLAITTAKAKTDLETEVKLIINVHHRNIIRLLGWSGKGSELLLVLEYMANGSLDKFLYGEKKGTLSWKQRVDIIFGIAKGLAYLHEQFHLRIIHRDIKSSNILLDDDFKPKIADFGLARLIGDDQTHQSTRFAGTYGYTAPEYALHGHLTEKVDTYSFGIVVLEIISGIRCTGLEIEPATGSLLEYAQNLYNDDMQLNLVDGTLDTNEFKAEHATKIIELALMCTQSPASLRPTMSQVVALLMNDLSLEQRSSSRATA